MAVISIFVGSLMVAITSKNDPVQGLIFGVGLWLILIAFLP